MPNVSKQLSLIFSKNAILEHHQEIADQIRDVLVKIETETELVQQDNLARGELIELAGISASLQKGEKSEWWSTNTDNLKCRFGEYDPPEYWGNIGLFESDFIAGSIRYPWMPSDISKEDEVPF